MFPGTRRTLRNDAAAMFLILLCYQAVLQVLAKERPPPPLNVRVDQGEMTWDPATEDGRNTTYTIQCCSSDNNCTEWKAVPACTKISSNSCNVTLPKAEAEHACVRLRVQAERQGSFSKPVNACRIHAEVELAPPRDVAMDTLNTYYTLRWEWDQSAEEFDNVTFTTQYVAARHLKSKKRSPKWLFVCKETSDKFCDFTTLNLHYFGTFMLRVQANANGCHSDWVQKEFRPDRDADVGPPSKVDLAPAGSGLDVFITDPLTSTNSSMKDHISHLYYLIYVWERSADRQDFTTPSLQSNVSLVTLSNLKPWTWYCVSVRSRYEFYDKNSSFTSPHCMQTEGAVPWWQTMGYIVCFLAVLLLLFSPFWCYQKVKETFHPSTKLASHFTQTLCDSPGSDTPHLLTLKSELELFCDNVTVCPEPTDLEVLIPPPEALTGPPSGLQPDTSGRHSRQNSSSSGDSGVYSTGGSSNMQQPNNSLSFAEDCLKGRVDLEKVKMHEMVTCLNSRLLIADEGTADMSV